MVLLIVYFILIVIAIYLNMKKYLIFFLLISFPIWSQRELVNFEIIEENIEREVLSKFLWELPNYTHLDNEIKGFDKPENIINRVKRNLQSYKNNDSICRYSNNIEQLRIACQISEGLSDFANLFTEEDFNYLKETYSVESKTRALDVDSYIKKGFILKKHSKEYYNEKKKQKSFTTNIFEGYPSVVIYDIYYTENKEIAIIIYGYNHTHGMPGYFILQNVRGIYWRIISKTNFKK
ncbi:hypothetical protein ULMA_20270 [Patiriisocius marinus]|uniref:Uncharacterized protein n=2 Tax=Patiriisocius marinus TaxID=1397112 RepID=A0A5J4IQ95_9FLAO|nr:hypothetical protein ULMA_20270 [Patiriisocius marinus]